MTMINAMLAAGIASDLASAAKDTAETFGFNWPHFFAQVISFSLVAFLLHRFAYKPILTVLEERKQRIATGLQNADQIKKELEATEAARQEVLMKANTEANRLIEEARSAAAKVKEIETQKAIASAEQIIAKAREATQADQARMLTELRKEVGSLVVRTTAQVVGKVLTDADQKRLIDEANKQLAA